MAFQVGAFGILGLAGYSMYNRSMNIKKQYTNDVFIHPDQETSARQYVVKTVGQRVDVLGSGLYDALMAMNWAVLGSPPPENENVVVFLNADAPQISWDILFGMSGLEVMRLANASMMPDARIVFELDALVPRVPLTEDIIKNVMIALEQFIDK